MASQSSVKVILWAIEIISSHILIKFSDNSPKSAFQARPIPQVSHAATMLIN
jgi:hypothetical protein